MPRSAGATNDDVLCSMMAATDTTGTPSARAGRSASALETAKVALPEAS